METQLITEEKVNTLYGGKTGTEEPAPTETEGGAIDVNPPAANYITGEEMRTDDINDAVEKKRVKQEREREKKIIMLHYLSFHPPTMPPLPPRTSAYSLHVGALVAHLLLRHLEAPRAQLPRDHLLPTVAAPCSCGGAHHRLVAHHLWGECVCECGYW